MRVMIYENRRQLLVNELFFRASGFSFQARKGNEYLIRFVIDGRDKLVLMNLEHYVPAGKTTNALSTEHVTSHDTKIRSIKDRLTTYLGIIEHHAIFNRNIANNVLDHSRKYMYYQVFEILIVVVATVSQIFIIKRLLTKTSVV